MTQLELPLKITHHPNKRGKWIIKIYRKRDGSLRGIDYYPGGFGDGALWKEAEQWTRDYNDLSDNYRRELTGEAYEPHMQDDSFFYDPEP